MRILFITNVPPPYQGTTIMNLYILDFFKRAGLIYYHIPVESSHTQKEIGSFSLKKLYNSFKVFLRIIKIRKKFQIAYLVMSVKGFAFLRHSLYVLLLFSLNKKVILHLRGIGFRNKTGFQKLLTNFIFKRSHLIQHTARNRFDIKGYKYKSIYDIPNGWPDLYNAYSINQNKVKPVLNIIFLSNLIESKGIFVLLKAINIIKADIKNCKFHFIGSWKSDITEQKFYSLVKEYNIGSLIGQIGAKYNDDKYNFLINMDIMVFPTYYEHETWGNVILEGMMFKLPIIASNYVGIPEMVKNGINGFLIDKKDYHALAEKLLILINSSKLREQFGEHGRELYLKHFQLKHFEKKIEKVFLEVEKSN